MIEQHESDIENWYFNHQEDQTLLKYLCEDRALRRGDAGCLTEQLLEGEVSKSQSKSEL